MEIWQFAERVGIFAAATALFIWWSWQREQRMSARIDELQTYCQTTLVALVKESTEAVVHCTEAMEHMSQVMREMTAATNHMEKAFPTNQNVIEASPNLLNWTAISTNVPFTNTFTFTDPSPASNSPRFYRAVVPYP